MNGRVVSTIAVAAAGSALGAGSAAGAVGHELRGLVSDIRVADGGVRLATAYPTRAVDARVVNLTLVSGSPLAGPPLKSSGSRGWVTPALTADGAVVAYAWQKSAKTKPVVQVITLDATGGQSAPETLSQPGKSAQPLSPVEVGPTGAAAVRFTRGGPKSAIQYLAFRRASAAEFGGATQLGSARESRETDFQVLLGPDGGGVVVGVPSAALGGEPYARRLTPEGGLGPRIPTGLGAHDETDVAMEFGPTGTLVLAAASLDDNGGDERSTVGVISLPVGAGAFTPVRTTDTGTARPDRDNLSVAVGAGDQTAVTVANGIHDLLVLEGTPASLAKTASIPGQFPFDARVFMAVDGALSVVWSDVRATGERLAGPPLIRVTRRAAGSSTFAAPHTALKPKSDTASLAHAALLRDGRIAIVVDRFDGSIDGGEALVPSLAALIQP